MRWLSIAASSSRARASLGFLPRRCLGWPPLFPRLRICDPAQLVGWVERSETHPGALRPDDGYRKSSTHPTRYALEINQVSGAEIDALIAELYRLPPDVVAKAREAVEAK